MKNILSVAIICFSVFQIHAITKRQPDHPYYVVAGSFAQEENALRYAAQIHANNYPARAEYNSTRGLYYVYVSVNLEKEMARDIVYRLRSEGGLFRDAWIFHGSFVPQAEIPERSAPVMGSHITHYSNPVIGDNKESIVLASNDVNEANAYASTSSVSPIVGQTVHSTSKAPIGEAFIFKLINKRTGEPVNGSVILTESERDTQGFKHIEANKTNYIGRPQNSRTSMVVICDLVGFNYQKKGINYASLVKGRAPGREIEVPIELTPYRRREYIDLHGVSFYDSSALLKPGSEGELMELVHLMSNPRYKIRLHGHTGTDISGPITLPGKSSDLFHFGPQNKKVHDNAKALSRFRAETIKTFLVNHGIDENRILTQGHGAMLDIYEQASANDRIEVEILKD